MNIAITDSGLGGLSIAARLYEWLKRESYPGYIKYINGVPRRNRGYNTIKGHGQKVRLLNNLPEGISERYNPELIVVACNTLSVLFSETVFNRKNSVSLINILDSGTNRILDEINSLNPSVLIILGSKTTIQSKIHANYFRSHLRSNFVVISQCCPQLASAIETDHSGDQIKNIISNSVRRVTKKIDKKESIIVLLACSHYEYVIEILQHSFNQQGFTQIRFVNPNLFLVRQLQQTLRRSYSRTSATGERPLSSPKLEVISGTQIENVEIELVAKNLERISPDTATRLKCYRHIPGLFGNPYS